MNLQLPGFFKQQSGQAFLMVVGALWMFWKAGAPDLLLWLVAGVGALFIVFEKIRAAVRGETPSS